MSSKAKGRRTLNKAINYLNENGYVVDETEMGGRFRKYKDFLAGYCTNCWKRDDECCNDYEPFEGFDLIALKGKHSLYIQVKTNVPSTQENYKRFAKKFVSRNIRCWVMTWYDHKGWRIQKYYGDGTINEVDLRG